MATARTLRSASRRLLLSPRAVADLEDIAACIARDNPRGAAAAIDALPTPCMAVARTPLSNAPGEDLAPGLRMAVHRHQVPVRVLAEDEFRIERIVHGARNLPGLL